MIFKSQIMVLNIRFSHKDQACISRREYTCHLINGCVPSIGFPSDASYGLTYFCGVHLIVLRTSYISDNSLGLRVLVKLSDSY